MQTISTLIIDDEPLARDIVKRYAADMEVINVVGECGMDLRP